MPLPKKVVKAAAKAAVDFQILDNGTATATATPVDALGELTTLPVGSPAPTWTVQDSTNATSTFLTLTPVTSDPTGLTQTITVTLPTPPPSPLPTGLVVSVTAGTISGSGNPIDIVPGPASNFVVAEQ